MTAAEAELIWDLLIEEVKVYSDPRGDERRSFVYGMTVRGCSEWRIQGDLGFGGKFRPTKWTVDCYREDMTSAREEIIKRANAKLAELRKRMGES